MNCETPNNLNFVSNKEALSFDAEASTKNNN